MKKKVAITAVSAFLLALLYLVIFGFSNQTGEESGSLSLAISKKCAELMNTISGKTWTEDVLGSMALFFEHPIRKLAHFTEYAVMGVLVYGIWSPWIPAKENKTGRYLLKKGKDKSGRRKLFLIAAAWVFISAAADEMHQFFVPGRYCSPADVLLDTVGGCAGIFFCLLTGKICRKLHE